MRVLRRRAGARTARDKRKSVVLENVLESLGDAVILTDESDCIHLLNQRAEELLGVSEAQVLGSPCSEAFRHSPWFAEMVERARVSGQSQARSEVTLGGPHHEVAVRASCSPIIGEGAAIQGTAVVIYDLSYQRMLEEEVRRNESLARLGTLVAGLAHEVKNPLGGIKGAAQLLAKRLSENSDVRSCTDIVIRETDRLSRLVEQLLVLGSPRQPDLVPINVHQILGQVLELMAPVAQQKSIGIRLEIDPSLPDVLGDEAQLSQLFLNLVKNAFEAMADGGMLKLATRLDTEMHILRRGSGGGPPLAGPAQMVRLSFSDTGPGFPSEQMEQIFEPFFTTRPKGTGLGLAICQRIVANHGGDIRAENSSGGGAVVTVLLPWARESK